MKPLSIDGCVTLGDESAWCVLSPCGLYRYLLGRCWDAALPMLGVTMLNPSRATNEISDATITRVIGRARQEGFGGLIVRNLAAFRATDPDLLLSCLDPVGPHNLDVLRMPLTETTVAAWGRIKPAIERRLSAATFGAIGRCTHVFQWTEKAPRRPRHPLYLAGSARMIAIDRAQT